MTIQAKKNSRMDPTATALQAKVISTISLTLFFILVVAGILGAVGLSVLGYPDWSSAVVFFVPLVIGFYILFALKVANQWEKAVVLRLGRFMGLRGPGAFWIVPVVDSIPAWIDHRVMVTPFAAEKTAT